jgi:hypothetical protein
MGTVTPLVEERVLFARKVPAAANQCLQEAAATPQADRAEAMLTRAAMLSPEVLAVDVARYKFYFYRGQLAEAEMVVRGTLAKSAEQGGFAEDWRQHDAPLAGREEAEGPQRYFLYALKALAFISLRREQRPQAAEILDALRLLDPQDLIGASVIEDLMDGSEEDE